MKIKSKRGNTRKEARKQTVHLCQLAMVTVYACTVYAVCVQRSQTGQQMEGI